MNEFRRIFCDQRAFKPGRLCTSPFENTTIANDMYWGQPHSWDAAAAMLQEIWNVTCEPTGWDIFGDEADIADQARLCTTIDSTSNLRWLLKTDNPIGMERPVLWDDAWPETVAVEVLLGDETTEREVAAMVSSAARRVVGVLPATCSDQERVKLLFKRAVDAARARAGHASTGFVRTLQVEL